MKVKVEKVIHPSAWINGISVGEVRVANIPPMRAHAVRNLASRFNRLLGEEKDRFLHVSYNSWKSHTNSTHSGKYSRPSKVKIMRPISPK